MRKSLIVAFALVCAGTISGDDLVWSKPLHQRVGQIRTKLNAPEALTRQQFACVELAFDMMFAKDPLLIGLSTEEIKKKGPVAVKIDEGKELVEFLTPGALATGRVDPTTYKILRKNKDVIIAQHLVSLTCKLIQVTKLRSL